MPNVGDKLYKITGIRFGMRLDAIQVEFDTFTVDGNNNNIPTGKRALRIPWDQSAFDALKTALTAALAAEPSLAGFTAT